MYDQERLRVGPYVFVQAVERNEGEIIPIPNMFAIQGGNVVTRRSVEMWAKENNYSITKE